MEMIEANNMCHERKIQAKTTIPRTMHEHGDIHAYLKNGVLMISIPSERNTSMKKRVIELFTGTTFTKQC